jgi:hypothetical protein
MSNEELHRRRDLEKRLTALEASDREFTEAQLRWAVFQGRNTRYAEETVVQLARAGLGLFWAGEGDGDD